MEMMDKSPSSVLKFTRTIKPKPINVMKRQKQDEQLTIYQMMVQITFPSTVMEMDEGAIKKALENKFPPNKIGMCNLNGNVVTIYLNDPPTIIKNVERRCRWQEGSSGN